MTARLSMELSIDAMEIFSQLQDEDGAIAHLQAKGYTWQQAADGVAWAMDQTDMDDQYFSQRDEDEQNRNREIQHSIDRLLAVRPTWRPYKRA